MRKGFRQFSITASLLLTTGALWADEPRQEAERSVGNPEVRFVLLSHAPRTGIRGFLEQRPSRIEFASRVEGGILTASITAADGKPLWLYQEGVAWRELEGEVRIVIGEQPFAGTYSPAIREEIDRIAQSGEGRLIRELALQLYTKAVGERLTAERRGLETAFQAMQGSFEPFSRALVTEDYVISRDGGFAVKSQHRDAVFANNYWTSPIPPHEDGVVMKDDPHIDDDCFGMCGSGCSGSFGCGFEGWFHEWVGEPQVTVNEGCECSRKVDGGDCGDPQWIQVVIRQGTAIHTIRGRSANGCIAHDACCRSLPGACFWNPVCHAIGLEALIECAVAGWPYSASYFGPHAEGNTYYLPAPEECYCAPCPTTEY